MKRSTFVLLSLAVLCALAVAGIVGWRVWQERGERPPKVATEEAEAGETTLVVDGSSGAASDSNPGTEDRPLRTIARAAALAASNNLRGITVRIQIRPGLYRESVTLGQWQGQTPAPIRFEGPTTGTAVLSGSDVWASWIPVRGTRLYRHAWPYRWGMAPLPTGWEEAKLPDIVRRREMLFANGRLLRQTLTSADLKKTTGGAFAVDEANGRIIIRLPKGMHISKTRIEVATRKQLLLIDGRTNVDVSNLTFRHAASSLQQPAVRVESSSDVGISNAKFVWNNWTGLTLNDDHDISIERSSFDHNGSMGLDVLRVKNLRMDQTSNSYNTWRGGLGRWYGWENGMKLSGVHEAELTRHTAQGNKSYGLWLDTDNSDVTIRGSRISDNRLAGLYLEASQGPITVDDTTIKGNGKYGILVANARDASVTNSRILNNAVAQIVLSGDQYGQPVRDWESRQALNVQSTGWTVRRNAIQAATGQLTVESTWSPGTWAGARPTYHWTDNAWTSNSERPFRVLGTSELGSLQEWQDRTGLDSGSTQRRVGS